MKTLADSLVRFAREDEGAAAAEYAVLVALIVISVAVAVEAFNLGGFGGIYDLVRNKVLACAGVGGGTC